MALNRKAAAPRLTSIPQAIEAALTPGTSQGKRSLLQWSGDKYGTVSVRVYVPEGIPASALNGFVLNYDTDGVLAEAPDDNTRRNQIVGRSVIMTKGGKPTGFGTMTDDDHATTVLVVVNAPDWADIHQVTLATA